MTKRILFVNTVVTGSHGQIVHDLAAAARAAGFDTDAAYGRGLPSPARIGGRIDGAIHLAATRAFDAHGFASTRATTAFINRLRKNPPDIIHLHNIHGYYLNIEILFNYLRESGIPTIWTLHDCWPFTGHCSHFVRANCDRWKTGCHACPLKNAYPSSLLLDRSHPNYIKKRAAFTNLRNLRIVTPSRWLANLIGQSFLKDYPLSVIPNGVDLSIFTPGDSPQDPRPLILAVAAPFDERKGFADTLKAAQSIPEANTLMVGLTPKQLKNLPHSPNLTGIPRTANRAELIALYRRASALINTTYEDTYPTVNMESLSCGTPVAAYNAGGCSEQLTPATGLLIPVGDVSQMITALRELLARPRNIIRAACREHAEQSFDRAQAMRQYVELYETII